MAKKQTVTVAAIVPASELVKFRQANTSIIGNANALLVNTAPSENRAYEILKLIAAKKKEIKKRKEEIIKPMNASLKAARALFAEVEAPLLEADIILRDKILAFQQEQQAKAAKEMERREKIQATHEAKGHQTYELAEVEPDVGESVTVKRWTYEMIDESKLPRKYLCADLGKIRAAVNDGERDIPGLKIFQKEGISVR